MGAGAPRLLQNVGGRVFRDVAIEQRRAKACHRDRR